MLQHHVALGRCLTLAQIKNHFGKYRNDEVKYKQILEEAAAADERRQRGEPLGDPPPQLSKKRLETATAHPHGPRSTMTNPDTMEDVSSPSLQPTVPLHGSPN